MSLTLSILVHQLSFFSNTIISSPTDYNKTVLWKVGPVKNEQSSVVKQYCIPEQLLHSLIEEAEFDPVFRIADEDF